MAINMNEVYMIKRDEKISSCILRPDAYKQMGISNPSIYKQAKNLICFYNGEVTLIKTQLTSFNEIYETKFILLEANDIKLLDIKHVTNKNIFIVPSLQHFYESYLPLQTETEEVIKQREENIFNIKRSTAFSR